MTALDDRIDDIQLGDTLPVTKQFRRDVRHAQERYTAPLGPTLIDLSHDLMGYVHVVESRHYEQRVGTEEDVQTVAKVMLAYFKHQLRLPECE